MVVTSAGRVAALDESCTPAPEGKVPTLTSVRLRRRTGYRGYSGAPTAPLTVQFGVYV